MVSKKHGTYRSIMNLNLRSVKLYEEDILLVGKGNVPSLEYHSRILTIYVQFYS